MSEFQDNIRIIRNVFSSGTPTLKPFQEVAYCFNFEIIPRSKSRIFRVEICGWKRLKEIAGGGEYEGIFQVWYGDQLPVQHRIDDYNRFLIVDSEYLEELIYSALRGKTISIQGIESADVDDTYITGVMKITARYTRIFK